MKTSKNVILLFSIAQPPITAQTPGGMSYPPIQRGGGGPPRWGPATYGNRSTGQGRDRPQTQNRRNVSPPPPPPPPSQSPPPPPPPPPKQPLGR